MQQRNGLGTMDRKDLHGYQERVVTHIIEHPYCGVFLDMGLGKTVSTLTALDELLYDRLESEKVLVVAPKRVADTVWAEECEKWAHLRHLKCSKIKGDARQRSIAAYANADIYIISRDNVVWLAELFCNELPYDTLVIDELSSFKNHKSKRFQALRRCRPFLKRVIGLTGTPTPNSLIELWPQIYLLDMGKRLGRTVTSYRNNYFLPDKHNGRIVYTYKARNFADGEIKSLISDICISMTAKDYLTLPELISNVVEVKFSDSLYQGYKDFKRKKLLELRDTNEQLFVPTAVSLVNKLLQYANGAIYDDNKNCHYLHELKLDALDEILDTSNGKPVLVAWTYRSDRERILKRFAAYNPRDLQTSQDIDDWNSGRISLMLAHPASAGHGLNLQAGGNIIVWYGLTYSLEQYLQFNARLHRQGQTEAVVVHHIVAKGTIDDEVMEALKRKADVQNGLMESLKVEMKNFPKNA